MKTSWQLPRIVRFLIGGLAVCIGLSNAMADDRPITIIVPYPAGGGSDTVARSMGRLLSPVLGQPVAVENISGAGARIGFQTLMRAAPDGLRLLLATSDLTINQALRNPPPWNIDRDFSYLAVVGTAGLVYMVNNNVPAKNMLEFVEYARKRAKDGKPVNYGSGGVGSILHLPTLELAAKHNLEMTHIPYRGAAPLVPALGSGEVELGVVNPVNAVGHEGRMRALAITGPRRHPMLPNVPTMAEAGFPDVSSTSFIAVIGPAKMPADVAARLVAALEKVAATDDFKKSMTAAGIEPGWVAGPALFPYIAADLNKWRDLSVKSGVTLQD